MRRIALLAFLVGIVSVMCISDAHAEGGKMRLSHFFNFEWFRDADGDGIPNCLDDDWAPPQDGTGYQDKHGLGSGSSDAMPDNGRAQGVSQNKYRHGSVNEVGAGDRIKSRLQSRDGSCKL